MARAKSADDTEALRGRIRARGLRVTAPRIAVLRNLEGQGAPISHGDLAAELSRDGWDRATIYRNLTDLTEAGLVRRTDVGDHIWRFELRTEDGHDRTEHAHFMCEACGDVICLPIESIHITASRDVPRALRKNQVEIQLKGRCDNCT